MIIVAGHIADYVQSFLRSKGASVYFLPAWGIWVIQLPVFTRAETVGSNISRYHLPDTLACIEIQSELNVSESEITLDWTVSTEALKRA